MGHLLNKFPTKVFKYIKHEALLDNKNEEEMTEQEKQEAMLAHEMLKARNQTIANAVAGTRTGKNFMISILLSKL